MFKAVEVPHWVVLIYTGQRRFNDQAVNQMIRDFVKSCKEVGRTFKVSSTDPNHTKDT
jgi:Mid domain of argonaute